MGGFLSHLSPERDSEILNATCGPIRGNIYKNRNKTVNGYLGIPFAKAPIDDLRFKKPFISDKWTTPLDCYSYGPSCPQSGVLASFIPESVVQKEDNCLTLNVFAPKWKSNEFPNGLPVLVYFYGGGFEIGLSSSLHDYSVTGTIPLKDVILVTANYRVGPLGFLTTGDDVAKGNYGLWDQTLALKWIQQHISSFGGDPDNVTISGTSAGGASVEWLSLSPHSNKLFKRFIAMSGTGYCMSIIRTNEEQGRVFQEFAKHHGYMGNDSENLFEWYKSLPASKFKDVEGFEKHASGLLSFLPNFDGDFFPKPFSELRKQAPHFDVMLTVGEYEGLDMAIHNPLFSDSIKNFKDIISLEFGEDVTSNTNETIEKIFNFYSKDVDWTDKAAVDKKLFEYVGDAMFNIAAQDTAESCTKHGDSVYLASFDYYNPETKNPFAHLLPFKAASHGAEFKYIFGTGPDGEFNPNEEEKKMMEVMGNFISNFVKYGNPNGKNISEIWEKYNSTNPGRYLKIDYPNSEMKDNFQNGRLKIYEEVRKNMNRYQRIVNGI